MTITKYEKDYGNGHIAVAHVIRPPYGDYHVETGDAKYDRVFKSAKGAHAYLVGFGYTEKGTTIYL